MALQYRIPFDVPSLPYRIQVGKDDPQQGVASLQSCNGQVNLQVDEECFQIPAGIVDALPHARIVLSWIPDEHRPQEQKDELLNFRAVAEDQVGLQNAASKAMEFYKKKYKDTLALQTQAPSRDYQQTFSQWFIGHSTRLSSVLVIIAVFSLWGLRGEGGNR